MARIVTGIWYVCVGGTVLMMVLLALVATGNWPGIGGGVLWPTSDHPQYKASASVGHNYRGFIPHGG